MLLLVTGVLRRWNSTRLQMAFNKSTCYRAVARDYGTCHKVVARNSLACAEIFMMRQLMYLRRLVVGTRRAAQDKTYVRDCFLSTVAGQPVRTYVR